MWNDFLAHENILNKSEARLQWYNEEVNQCKNPIQGSRDITTHLGDKKSVNISWECHYN